MTTRNPEQQIQRLDWPEVERAVSNLAQKLPSECYLWGMPRGGSLVAVMLSHAHADIPGNKNHILSTASFAEAVAVLPRPNHRDWPLYFVDDIIDTGTTITEDIEPLIPEAHKDRWYSYICLWIRYSCHLIPTYYAYKLLDDCWLQFPWER